MVLEKWFKRPSFSRVESETSGKKESEIAPESSPLSDPPSSFVFNEISPQSEQDAEAQLQAALYLSTQGEDVKSPGQSFQSTEAGSTSASQRIMKNGKETVISSDGEETDSDFMSDDPNDLFSLFSKDKPKPAPTQGRKVTSPKKWKFNLDSLVVDAVDDNEVEANVSRFKANLAQGPRESPAPAGNKLNESVLMTALGNTENGPASHRVLGAIRRTNALDHDSIWLFFEGTQKVQQAPEFPLHICAPGTKMEILRDRAVRERMIMSGNFIQMALAKGILSDDIILWMFLSIPFEPRNELCSAYCRIIESVDQERLGLLIRPANVDDLFVGLGARKHAFDPSAKIVPMNHHEFITAPRLEDHRPLISVIKMFRQITSWLANDTKEHIAVLLLRLTLDNSLTADPTVSAELQWAINEVLEPESFAKEGSDGMLHRVCTIFYNTVEDVRIQSRICRHILPTSDWFATVRCRLAISFLLKNPAPLAESPEKLLDLNRITELLTSDERFQVKRFQGNADYDWRELIALTVLLNIAIDASALELNYRGTLTDKDFNADIDKLANQIKMIYCSIQVSGASHMTLTLAKGDLEALHYRILYSIRSKPPPKKSLFESHAKQDGDIRNVFSKYTAKATENSEIPIR